MCTDYACVYACMPIRRLVINFQSTIIVCAYVDTQIHIHMHIHTLSCRQTQAFNLPFVTCTHTYIPRTRTLTRLLEKGFRIWEGMVLYIRPSLEIGIHWGTLAYIRWGIRLECARGGEAGGGRQSCRHAATCIHIYIEPCACMYTYHQLLSNHCGYKINAIMKCGTVVIMQAVYCLIGSVKKKSL